MTSRKNLEDAIRGNESLPGTTEAPDPMAAVEARAQAYQAASEHHQEKQDIRQVVQEAKRKFNPSAQEEAELNQSEERLQKALDVSIEQEGLAKSLKDEAGELEETLPEKVKEAQALLQEIQDEKNETDKNLEAALKEDPSDEAYIEKLQERTARLNKMHQRTQQDLITLEKQVPRVAKFKQGCEALFGQGGKPPGPQGREAQSLAEVNQALNQQAGKVERANAALAIPLNALKSLCSSISNAISSAWNSITGTKKELAEMKQNKPERSPKPSAEMK
jgi:hypothetical protein